MRGLRDKVHHRHRGCLGDRPGHGRHAWWRRGRGSSPPTWPKNRAAPLVSGAPAAAGSWTFRRVDVADEASVAELVAAAVGFGGRVDGLVNAAGVAGAARSTCSL